MERLSDHPFLSWFPTPPPSRAATGETVYSHQGESPAAVPGHLREETDARARCLHEAGGLRPGSIPALNQGCAEYIWGRGGLFCNH